MRIRMRLGVPLPGPFVMTAERGRKARPGNAGVWGMVVAVLLLVGGLVRLVGWLT